MDSRKCIQTILLCSILISTLSGLFVCAQRNIRIQDGDQNTNALTYTREVLLSLRHQPLSMTVPNININFDETKREKKKKKGSRGEIRNRLRRRGARLPMPSVTLTNARSLVNKMDHLQALVKYDGDYRRSNIVCVTETWFSEEKFHNPDIDGYTSYHQKRKGADSSCM